MTAEVAIINRHAIALAADSAVTVGRDKVWKTANKLFSLGPRHDIAIMVYGSGDFLGLTWESIIKEFRRRSAGVVFRSVADCTEALRDFLLRGEIFGREDQQKHSVVFPVFDILSSGEFKSDAQLIEYVKKFRAILQGDDQVIPALDEKALRDAIKGLLETFFEQQLQRPLAPRVLEEVQGLAVDFFKAKRTSLYHTGVVVAGFGLDEFHPVLTHNIVDGLWGGNIRWWDGGNGKNLNTTDHYNEFPIIPFAQDDMSFQFMTGISQGYLTFIRQSLEQILPGAFDAVLEKFVPEGKRAEAKQKNSDLSLRLVETVMERLLDKVRREQYQPINTAVGALPKEEMAVVAESLVDITSLKRKVDSKVESVGGPVDVAVISKGDGLVWMKRKHYFDGTKNADFFARKKFRDGEKQ